MPKKGQPYSRQVTPANKAAKKEEVLELRGKGFTVSEIATKAKVSTRTIRKWRQEDEDFAVAYSVADEQYRDFWVKNCRDYALNPDNPHRHLMLMFLTKQADPTFRDNHKTELSVSPELANSLTALAKLAEKA